MTDDPMDLSLKDIKNWQNPLLSALVSYLRLLLDWLHNPQLDI